uniref:Uncharacterized protein n=1 Tax=Octopus bimaculoides TaxID=37653 RepID=A0A0L8I1P2_OCTBM
MLLFWILSSTSLCDFDHTSLSLVNKEFADMSHQYWGRRRRIKNKNVTKK